MTEQEQIYFDLEIVGKSADSEIWLICDRGHLVQHEVGVLRTSVLTGNYFVQFNIRGSFYPIHLGADAHYTQQQIESGPSCPPPPIILSDPEEIIERR